MTEGKNLKVELDYHRNMQPKLSEQEHMGYLEQFLGLVRYIKQKGREELFPRYIPLIQDSITIARKVGYEKLADRYTTLFQKEALVFEF